ncbi:MAG: hypothetical protein ACXWQO_06970 [Bdellovibrionota bacterium]
MRVFAALLLAFVYSCGSHSAKVEIFGLAAGEFETTERDVQFADFVQKFDLESSRYKLEYKTGGTSLGLKISEDGKSLGKWLPRNASANPEAQVFSYQLGRFLGMSKLVAASAHFTIKGRTLDTFAHMLEGANEVNALRLENKTNLLRDLGINSAQMAGVFTRKFPNDTKEARGIADTAANSINSSHPIAGFITATGSRPSAETKMTLAGVKNKSGKFPSATELELAREFSQIMVLDILCGQWDRWSGGNVEASWEGDTVYFVARDNGGASLNNSSHLNQYLGIVSRFDRAQIERVRSLVELLQGQDSAGLISALQLKTNPKFLIARANALLAQVKKLVGQYGDGAVFF